MNHEIDFDPDDIYIRDCSLLCSVASLFSQRQWQNFVLNAGELRLVLFVWGTGPFRLAV